MATTGVRRDIFLILIILITIAGNLKAYDNVGHRHEHIHHAGDDNNATLGEHDDDDDDSAEHEDEGHLHDHDGNKTIHNTPIAEASTSSWFYVNSAINLLSPCYTAIDYHILDRKQGRLDVIEEETVQFSLSLNTTNDGDCSSSSSRDMILWLRVVVEPMHVQAAALVNSETDILSPDLVDTVVIALRPNARFPVRVYARGLFLGYSKLHFQGLAKNVDTKTAIFNASQLPDSQWVTFRSGKIATFRYRRIMDIVFQGIIFALIICGNIGIGLNVNWKEICKVLKKPIGPAIGFGCQYIVMPLAGFTVVSLIDLPPNVALGIFLMGCAPGGGGSNYHTYFLGGNLPLSVTMTFVSTAAAIAMMPLWVFTLGGRVANAAKDGIQIDYRGIFGALFNSIAPFLIGILINWRRPALAKRIFRDIVRPLLIFVFTYMLTVGTYTNLYIFKLMRPKVLIAGLSLPWSGFLLGLIIALILGQSRSIAVTIAIETGIQAAGVAFATLYLSLPQPDADISVVGPVSVLMFTPVPLWIAEIIRGIYLCIKRGRCFIFDSCRKNQNQNEDEDGGGEIVGEEDADDFVIVESDDVTPLPPDIQKDEEKQQPRLTVESVYYDAES